jgi:NhaP-type Na+/H+ or K+/H+ antiporter
MDIDSTVSTVAATLGGFILLYGVCSLVIKEKLYISEACNQAFFCKQNYDLNSSCLLILAVAILYGILCGPVGFNLINIDDWAYKQDVTRQFTRIVIAIQVLDKAL